MALRCCRLSGSWQALGALPSPAEWGSLVHRCAQQRITENTSGPVHPDDPCQLGGLERSGPAAEPSPGPQDEPDVAGAFGRGEQEQRPGRLGEWVHPRQQGVVQRYAQAEFVRQGWRPSSCSVVSLNYDFAPPPMESSPSTCRTPARPTRR